MAASAVPAVDETLDELRLVHLDLIRFEQEQRVRDAYSGANAETREATLKRFESARSAEHAAWLPSLPTLRSVEALFENGVVAAGPDVAGDFVSVLGMRVVPGAFVAHESGKGEPITVHFEVLYPTPIPQVIELGLDWVSADGTRTPARREMFSSREFGEGLAMYVRPPVGPPAEWSIVPVLSVGEREVRGAGVAVSSFGELDAVRAELKAGVTGSRAHAVRALARDWNRLRETGVRPTHGAGIGERLTHFGFSGGSAWNQDYSWISIGEEDRVGAWGFEPEGDLKGAVLMLTDGRRDPTAAFAGTLSSLWKAFALERSQLVLSISFTGDAEDVARLDALLAELVVQGVERPTLIAAGDAAILLPMHLRSLQSDTIGRVFLHSTPTVANGVRVSLGAPVLGLAYQQAEEQVVRSIDEKAAHAGDAPERLWVRRRAPAFLTELEVPTLLGRWMDDEL